MRRLRLGDKANRFVYRFQGLRSPRAGLFRAVFHHLIEKRFVVTETVIALLQVNQHARYRFGDFAFQVAIHFAFKMLFQLRNSFPGNRGEDIQQVGDARFLFQIVTHYRRLVGVGDRTFNLLDHRFRIFQQADDVVAVVVGLGHLFRRLQQRQHARAGFRDKRLRHFKNIAVDGVKTLGEGNKFLSNIRMTDAIVHVVRCFDDENVIHVEGSTDPIRDMDTIDLELVMSDMEMVDRRIDKAQKAAKGDKKFLHETEVFQGLREWLDQGKSARGYLPQVPEDDAALIATSELLSLKPVIYAANLDEDGFSDPEAVPYYRLVEERAAAQGAQVIPVCAKLEAEIAELDAEEKKMFLDDLGVAESGLDRLVKASYTLLGLISYLTSGEDECRAWTIRRGTKAPQAAGKIHSDFERGFIRAEVVSYDDLMACGSMAAAREKGLIRSEGKEYIVQDGDIILFRFNV